jgi:hypothetical protein
MILLFALPFCGFGQEKVVQTEVKTDTAKVLQENVQQKKKEQIKSVPITNKNIEAIRMQNKKATMEQMHTINKAIRKSMTIHKHR